MKKRCMFGDNKSVVDRSMNLHSNVHKRHADLPFRHVRETIIVGIVSCFFIQVSLNLSGMLIKH